jgi:hypothetical protein
MQQLPGFSMGNQEIKGMKYNGWGGGNQIQNKSGTRTLLLLGQFSVSPTTSLLSHSGYPALLYWRERTLS